MRYFLLVVELFLIFEEERVGVAQGRLLVYKFLEEEDVGVGQAEIGIAFLRRMVLQEYKRAVQF